MAPRPRKMTRRQKLIAFAPALVVGCATVFIASGASVVPGATASTVNISGEVTGAVSTNATMTGCADTVLDNFETGFDSTDNCTVTFAANYASGAEVQIEDANNGNAAFFCSDGDEGAGGTRDCSQAGNRVENVGAAGSAITNDTAGFAVTALTAGPGANETFTGFTVNAAPGAGDSVWNPVTDADQELCYTDEPNTSSTCSFRFAADGDAATGNGDYTGTIDLTTAQH